MTQFLFRRDNTCLNKDTREELVLVEPSPEADPGADAVPDPEAAIPEAAAEEEAS